MQFNPFEFRHIDLEYVSALASCVPSARHAARYASIVVDRHRSRLLRGVATSAFELASDTSVSVDERIERVSSDLTKLLDHEGRGDAVAADEAMRRTIQRLEDRVAGRHHYIGTGIADIDRKLGGGGKRGDLVVLAARPSMGKTAMALTWALTMARSLPVGFLSMEMSEEEMMDRAVSQLGHIGLGEVQMPRASDIFWARVSAAADKVKSLRLFIDDQGGLNLSQVRAKARSMRRRHGIEVLFVDYLQLMEGRDARMARTYQLEEISRGLKALAKELSISVVGAGPGVPAGGQAQGFRAADGGPEGLGRHRAGRRRGITATKASAIS